MADDTVAALPLVRANDNPHMAYPLMKDQLASAAFDLYSEYEPTGAFALIAPDAEWDAEPANINRDRSIRARPDKDTQRESDNKDILDKQHAAFKCARVTLKKPIVASIGTGLCSAIAASHTTDFLWDCSVLFMVEWLDVKCGTMQSKHVGHVLDTLAVVCKSSADFPAHSAHFSLTARPLRAVEKLATTSFVPNEQQLFTMLKQSFDHIPESKTLMCIRPPFWKTRIALSLTKSPVRGLLVVPCSSVAFKSPGPAPLPGSDLLRRCVVEAKLALALNRKLLFVEDQPECHGFSGSARDRSLGLKKGV
jgi:hypothetical protein